MGIREDAARMKADAPDMAVTTVEIRNKALGAMIEALEAHKEEIYTANKKDLEEAEKNQISPAVIKRLRFNEEKMSGAVDGIRQLMSLEDPIGRVTLHRQLDQDLILKRVTVPIGVIGVIFEARPDALIQISALCIKSGNCAILKGGKETLYTNQAIFRVIYEAAVSAGLPKGCLLQATAHSEIDELLGCEESVDLLIPRGSNAFVQYIMEHTKIPVMGHADGVCHTYVDQDADLDKVMPIIIDAKTQYTAACNATETLLVHRNIAEEFLPKAQEVLESRGVTLRGNREVAKLLSVEEMKETDFHMEYLALTLSVKIVNSVEEAVAHINHFGSHHTDAILTENDQTAEYFMQRVDSAGVYRNCSTRFADGFRYGFGAEVGISTSKLHARGPVGLEGLVTYKYRLTGQGNIVEDYASHKKDFHFKDL